MNPIRLWGGALALLLSTSLGAQSLMINPIPDLDPQFIRGVDVSTLAAVEQAGGRFFHENGQPGDALAILKDHGVNWIRLRLWNDPTNAEDVVVGGKLLSRKGEPFGGGNNDLATDLGLAQRAKALGLKVLLDFHYSDLWADPSHQTPPKAWKNLDQAATVEALYQFTKKTLKAFQDAGAAPDMVQLGNETNGGMVWPVGKTFQADPSEVVGGVDGFAALLSAGARAVREADPGILIAVHLADGGDQGLYRYMFDELTKREVDYDVIGLSFYPYWHGTIEQLSNNMNSVSVRYGKPVAVLETAYARSQEDADGYGNVFGPGLDKSGGYKASLQGQATAIREVMAAVADVPGGQGMGVFYWEPAWLPVRGVGWRSGEGNNWENQTLFDSQGRALASMNVFRAVAGTQDFREATPQSAPPIRLTVSLDQREWELPTQVQAAFSDDAYRLADVTWTPLDRSKITKPQTTSLRGVLTGTKVPVVAVLNVVALSNQLSDAGFEVGSLGDWKVEGPSQTLVIEKNPGNARNGDFTLKYWNEKAFQVAARRRIEGLKDGTYTFKAWSMGGGGEKSIVWSARSPGQDEVKASVRHTGWLKWTQVVLRGISVRGGTVDLELVIDGREGCWGNIDDLELIREGE